MTKEQIEELYITQNLGQREVAKRLNCSHTNLRYWIKKYNIIKTTIQNSERTCPKCKNTLPINLFHNRRNGTGNSTYCKPCTLKQTLDRQRELKRKCVEYKGGCCQNCGYNKYLGALDFHHLDPKQKDFSLSHRSRTSFNQEVIDELDKCILLCANCHREEHGKLSGSYDPD